MLGILCMRGGRQIDCPEGQSARGFTFVEIVFVVSIILVLAGMAIALWMGVYGKKVFNIVAMTDVVNTARAVEAIADGRQFELTVSGPGLIPGLPAARISKGTTLFVRRLLEGNNYTLYIRGVHSSGSIVYYFQDGTLYADSEPL